ncbi:predicted protein [Scheffersomyces stipitis CBS 6054]|uniref:SYO1-like TPR repeats domain-containing protein n=1 Tax=Scheffersomyces stipitis (strain ATCC 58785 / CBS 6054 / NBRC 10063 / NRRL Y-11545) TaxID=322104 RepID=A3LSF9_PICST|nr:predicted protein [Scheffersomyces stipitis CBS 6054]ABN65560.1 predicted protein [Scheffersomyces stipitis CBS 6054]KAG2734034.1 hypothetical protein G9P44_003559 [Scheffersomyces stipitis]
MGKLKKGRRNQKARLNPIGTNPKASSKDEKRDENTRQSKILPLINKLKSTVANDRSMALGAITVLAEDDRMRSLLLKEKLVSIVMEQCLNDANDEIIVESFGLLRNLGIEEGYDVLKYYWRSNIWTAIEAAIAKIQTSYKYLVENGANPAGNKNDKSKVQLLYDFTENILSLIIVLASGSDDLYESIFDKIDPILKFVSDLLTSEISTTSGFKISTKLFNSLLEFIYEFSTESEDFIRKFSLDINFDFAKLFAYVEAKESHYNNLTRVYIEGIKFNNFEVLSQGENKYEVGTQFLSNIFEIIVTTDLELLKKNIHAIKNPDNSSKPIQKDANTLETDLSKGYDLALQTKLELTTLEVALDLITSLLEYLSTNDNDEPLNLPTPTVEVLLNKIYPSLVELNNFENANKGMLSLREKILVALNNLTWLMLSNESLPVAWFEKSLALWDLIISSANTSDVVLQKNCLNVLWGITKSLGPEVRSKLQPSIVDELIAKCQTIMEKQNEADETDIELYLSIVGFLGNLAPVVGNTQITSKISQFLITTIELLCNSTVTTVTSPAKIEVVLEAINVIYEIFGDIEFDYDYEIFVQQGYLQKLSLLEPKVKELYKKIDKNKYPHLKAKGEETWINLGRFIQYKQSERA